MLMSTTFFTFQVLFSYTLQSQDTRGIITSGQHIARNTKIQYVGSYILLILVTTFTYNENYNLSLMYVCHVI